MPADDGFVETPPAVADVAAGVLFGSRRPGSDRRPRRLLLPGMGRGRLFAAVQRYCRGDCWHLSGIGPYPVPDAVGVERNAARADYARREFGDAPVTVQTGDFLLDPPSGAVDWVVMNPPYIRYNRLDETRREQYRERFETTTGKFPLYVPFVEQALRCLRPGGHLTAILPVKALTTDQTLPLRHLLRQHVVHQVQYLPPAVFDRTVETVVLTVERADPTESPASSPLWVEPVFVYEVDTMELLRRVGVDDAEAAHEQYRSTLNNYQERVRRLDSDGWQSDPAPPREPIIDEFPADSSPAVGETTAQSALSEW